MFVVATASFFVFVFLCLRCACYSVSSVLCRQYSCSWLPGKARHQTDRLYVSWDATQLGRFRV